MNKQKSDLKILLLQVRQDEVTIQEEFDEFVRFGELRPDQITQLNAFQNMNFEPNVIEGYDALFIGGSSDVTVTEPEKYPFLPSCKKLVRYCYDNDIPLLASCFGFQVVVEELGGKVERKEHMEIGVLPLYVSEGGKDDTLLHDTPAEFLGVVGHKDYAVTLPPESILLVYSDKCEHHALQIKDKPLYGFQFHPEIDAPDLAIRFDRYIDRYMDDSDEIRQIRDSISGDTPEANALIKKFINRIILEEQD